MSAAVVVDKKSASRESFLSVWPVIREELLAYMDQEKMPAEAKEWFRKVCLASTFPSPAQTLTALGRTWTATLLEVRLHPLAAQGAS